MKNKRPYLSDVTAVPESKRNITGGVLKPPDNFKESYLKASICRDWAYRFRIFGILDVLL